VNWSYDSLWLKATLYINRALKESREGPLFPFWASLALELLARATLAKVHPALLADPQDGENILYVFGYGHAKTPKSIPVKTVFTRCSAIISDFTKDDVASAMVIIDRRNEELHSGGVAFQDLPTQFWLASYFRICSTLLAFQGRPLSDFLGAGEATAALKMIDVDRARTRGIVAATIANAAKAFQHFPESVQAERRTSGALLARRALGRFAKVVSCPACSSEAQLEGEQITSTEPQLRDDMIVRNTAVLPTAFHCYACALKLGSHAELDAANLGGQFQQEETFDPVEYYGADVDPADYFEPEYGND
jgi:hypothetical protein